MSPKTGATPLGRVVLTFPAVLAFLRHRENPLTFFDRHCRGDWGLVDAAQAAANDRAVRESGRIRSEYETAAGFRVLVVTEADRSFTCFLLPDEA